MYAFIEQHNIALLSISQLIALITSYVSLHLLGYMKIEPWKFWRWLIAGLIGIGLWAMHFTALMSVDLGFPVAYDRWLTLLSLFVAVGTSYAAFGCFGGGGSKSRYVGASLLLGLGAVSMHMIGVEAIQATKQYDPAMVVLSGAIGVAAAMLVFGIAARREPRQGAAARFFCALLLTAGMTFMHSVGMHGTTFAPQAAIAGRPYFGPVSNWLAHTVAHVTIGIVLAALIAVYLHRLTYNDRKHKSLFENYPDVILLVDGNGTILQSNRAAAGAFGWEPEALAGRTFDLLVSEEDRSRAIETLRQAAGGAPVELELTIRHRSGRTLYFQTKAIPHTGDPAGQSIYVVLKDVTEAKLARRKQTQMEMQFHSVVETALDAVIVTDENMNILVWNKGARKMFGYSEEEVLGQRIDFIIPQRLQPSHREAVERYRRTQKGRIVGTTQELHGVRKGGEEFPLELSISAWKVEGTAYYSAIIRDITERKAAERALRVSEERYRQLIESFPEAIFIGQGNRWVYANETGAKLLGASSREQLLGRDVFSFVHPEYHANIHARIRLTETEERRTERMEEKWIRFDGSEIHVQVSAIPARLGDTDGLVRIVLVRDMTELRKARELYERSEKLSVAGELAAGIAHEIRNPLTAIKGFLQLMSEEQEPPYYDIIRSELSRIEFVISELLMIAKPQQVRFVKRRIADIAVQVVALLESQAIMSDVSIVCDIEAEDAEVLCDENQMKQVLINIMKNGIEAMADGGTLHVSLERDGAFAVRIRIRDEGIGISPDMLKRLGEPFYTTKEKGTGLGLMTSYRIVGNHRGRISVDSELGRGTTFTISLPVSRDDDGLEDMYPF
ncbi:PAS domain S-box protein [Paenibacillus sp.]|uniref:PAS domain S-box protein n=1 Tax=Paenibacillus sp. TaxID=58172 RepID=UPI002D430521|nr:PAS domain S-box protein [Paenibacillus sp.]HZG87750.1 PAS domain S-box protein [Paenibacillus sp.]